MWKYNLFVILVFFYANAISIEIPDEIFYVSEVYDAVKEEATEYQLENVLLADSNSAGIQEDLSSEKCAGGLLDFIQCVVASKIDSFRQELSKVAFPEKPPEVTQPQIMNSKIQGSLEEWLEKFTKDLTIQHTNCTSDE